MSIPELSKAGTSIEFDVYGDGEKLGTMVVGRGSVTWYGKRRRNGKELSWTQFAQLMDEQA